MAALGVAKYPDRMTIVGENAAQGTGGGIIKSGTSNAYTNVPCAYLEQSIENQVISADQRVSIQQYILELPVIHSGVRINATANQKFVVAARGSEPAKTFRPVATPDHLGVIYRAVCTKEN